MEVFGLRKLLEGIVGKLTLSEIATDASTAVAALTKKMKGMQFLQFCVFLTDPVNLQYAKMSLTKFCLCFLQYATQCLFLFREIPK
jgi:hypothetical protein